MCLGGTPVLVQPERVRVLVVELLPDDPVAPLRAHVVALGRRRVGPVEEVDVRVGRHGVQELHCRPRALGVRVAPPEHGLDPPHERQPAVVAQDVPELGVDASLDRVVGARKQPLGRQDRVQGGEEGPPRDEPRERRPRLPEPLVSKLAPAVDHARVLEEVGPELAPPQVALHPPAGLAEGVQVRQLERERAGPPAGLEPRPRRRVPPHLRERVEEAPLDSRAQPYPADGRREPRAAVAHHHTRGRDRRHQRLPRPRGLGPRHAPRDHVLPVVV